MYCTDWYFIDGLVQDCSNSNTLAMEWLQSCTKPANYVCHTISGKAGITVVCTAAGVKFMFYIVSPGLASSYVISVTVVHPKDMYSGRALLDL